MIKFRSGGGKTVQIGYVNNNRQKCLGHRGRPGNKNGQKAYKMHCLVCEHVYGANGCDVFERQCPGICKKSTAPGPDY